jgi:hypothetical protein
VIHSISVTVSRENSVKREKKTLKREKKNTVYRFRTLFKDLPLKYQIVY